MSQKEAPRGIELCEIFEIENEIVLYFFRLVSGLLWAEKRNGIILNFIVRGNPWNFSGLWRSKKEHYAYECP